MDAKEQLYGLNKIIMDRADSRLAMDAHNAIDAVRRMTYGMDYFKIPMKTGAVKQQGTDDWEINTHVLLNYLQDAIEVWQRNRYRDTAVNMFMERFDQLNRETDQLLKEEDEGL